MSDKRFHHTHDYSLKRNILENLHYALTVGFPEDRGGKMEMKVDDGSDLRYYGSTLHAFLIPLEDPKPSNNNETSRNEKSSDVSDYYCVYKEHEKILTINPYSDIPVHSSHGKPFRGHILHPTKTGTDNSNNSQHTRFEQITATITFEDSKECITFRKKYHNEFNIVWDGQFFPVNKIQYPFWVSHSAGDRVSDEVRDATANAHNWTIHPPTIMAIYQGVEPHHDKSGKQVIKPVDQKLP